MSDMGEYVRYVDMGIYVRSYDMGWYVRYGNVTGLNWLWYYMFDTGKVIVTKLN